MSEIKTRSIHNIEVKMENMNPNSMRYAALQNAKLFKASWIGLGRALYSIWKDKLYRNWGYMQFDTYTTKEIGIRKQTALKLLRSYYFLEKEEPNYLREQTDEKKEPAALPSLEAVDALRLASKKKTIDREDYADIKKKVLKEGRPAEEVKKSLTQLIRQREELNPEEARKKRRDALIKRLVSTLKSVSTELKVSKMLPIDILKDTEKLLSKLQAEIK